MIKKYFVLLFLVFNCSFLVGQVKTGDKSIDSLFSVLPNIKIDTARVINLNLIAEKYRYLNPNLGVFYANKALHLSKNIKWNDGIALSLRNIGQNYYVLGDYQKANINYDKALTFVKSKFYTSLLLNSKGSLELVKSNHTKALEYFFKSLKICEEIKIKSGIARAYFGISNIYNRIRDYKKAILFNKKSLELNTQLNLKSEICDNLSLMGEIYRDDNKQFAIALNYFFKALNLGTRTNNKQIIAHTNAKIEQVYQLQEKQDLALKHIFAGKKIAQEINDNRLVSGFTVDEGQIYLLQYEQDSLNPKKYFLLRKSENLLLDGLKYFKKSKDLFNISVCYETLIYVYQYQKKYKASSEMSLNYAYTKDSIYSEKAKETVKNLEDHRTIGLKNDQIKINKINLEAKEKQKWLYIFGIGFLMLFGSLLFYQSQNRKKTNEKLQSLNSELDLANKTKIKFLSILNHDLRSPVYNFIHFMQLQKQSPELLDEQTKKTIENKTISTAENLLFSMEDLLLWSKGELENFEPKLKSVAINDIFDYTKKHFESEEKVTIIFENFENIILITDENFLKTIIRNFTGNAIKALEDTINPSITWKAFILNNEIYLSISDNGSGSNQDKFKALYDENEVVGIKTGLGLHLIRDIAKAINCEITINSKIGFGTIFTLKFQ